MLELLKDSWGLIITILSSCLDIVQSALSLVIIDDPFWRGVEFTIVALLLWQHRKAVISGVDSVPLLGGLVARGLSLADELAEKILEKGSQLISFVHVNTWDRLVKLVKKADSDLRD